MSFHKHNQQGYFGESFVRVLASAAGLIAGKQDLDQTGVDFSIDLPGALGTIRYPKIEAQVKSWSNPTGSSNAWHYPMAAEHYNKLAGPGFVVKRFLFLVIVPADVRMYAEADEVSLRLNHCAYWTSLEAEKLIEPAENRQRTVYVPKSNLLTASSLHALLQPLPTQRTAS